MKYFWHKKRITKEAVRFDYCLIIRLLNTGQQAEGPDGDEGPPASQCLLLPTENLKIIFKISRLIKCCWLVRPGCQLSPMKAGYGCSCLKLSICVLADPSSSER